MLDPAANQHDPFTTIPEGSDDGAGDDHQDSEVSCYSWLPQPQPQPQLQLQPLPERT